MSDLKKGTDPNAYLPSSTTQKAGYSSSADLSGLVQRCAITRISDFSCKNVYPGRRDPIRFPVMEGVLITRRLIVIPIFKNAIFKFEPGSDGVIIPL